MATFEAEAFEDLHSRCVALLVAAPASTRQRRAGDLESLAFEEFKKRRDSLAAPFAFRGREDSLDLASLARRILQSRPRLANEPLVRQIDELSRVLRLNQDDCAALIERAIDLGTQPKELTRICAAMYYRECHFQALCLHDMAQSLTTSTPDPCSVAFFAMLGGQKFVKGVFEALGLLLRDLTGDRTGDQLFLSHAGAMIQLLVETLLAYFYAFKATAEEAEQVIALLPHVVMASHVVIGQGWTVSDLDLTNLREEHNDISIKLCFVLVCMCHARDGAASDCKLDISRIPADANPASLQIQDFIVRPDGDQLLTGSTLGNKMRSGTAQQPYWDEESQLGQFLCFVISGILLGDERALRNGYVHWHALQFMLDEVLLSRSIIGDSCTSRLILGIVLDVLSKALLPDLRRWAAVKKLEMQAVSYRLMAPDGLQIAILRTINRLCRTYPSACEKFRELALHCADTFHLTAAQDTRPLQDSSMVPSGLDAMGRQSGFMNQDRQGSMLDTWGQQSNLLFGQMASSQSQGFSDASAPWIGAPPSTIGTAQLPMVAARHDNSALYAEILDLVATVCGRGTLATAHAVSSKLTNHSNQWFNWAFLLDTLMQHAHAPSQLLLPSGSSAAGTESMINCSPAPVVVALVRLVSAMCSSHLWICQPPPPMTGPLSGQPLQTVLHSGSLNVDNYGALLVELLGTHPVATVKAACLGALAHLDFSPAGARTIFTAITATLPTMLSGICDVRGSSSIVGSDGLLAIELLACSLRLVQAVPLNKGRYSLDLQPLTHVVIHYVFLKVLSDMEEFAKAPRYWRLANLALRWLRMALHGPLPFGSSPAGNVALIEPYAMGDATVASQVASLNVAGNATAYVFRCLLALDSPIFSRVIYLTTLRGRGVDALCEGRRSGALRPFMEQTSRVGLDVVRLLLQRDVLFCRLHSQRAKQHLEEQQAKLDDSTLLLTHKLLFAEFAFTYPPEDGDDRSMFNNSVNAFSGRRMWQGFAMPPAASGTSGRRMNPSNFSLLLQFAGSHRSSEISKLAFFMFSQCAFRDPVTALQMLQLERWRLHRFVADVHDMILQPECDNALSAMNELTDKWDGQDGKAGTRFAFEVTEMDTPNDAACHLDMSSFLTGMPLCHALDVVYQLADDSMVQSADIVAFATCSGLGGNMRGTGLRTTSSDEAMFKSAYLRGLDIPTEWLGRDAAKCASGVGTTPPATLTMTSCRLLALRTLVMLQSEIMSDAASTAVAPKLAQVLLGLDPDGSKLDGAVEIDPRFNGQPFPLEAVMQLLAQPPPVPSFPQTTAGRTPSSGALASFRIPVISYAVEQHASYEAALGILLGLLSTPTLREVAFRYMVHMWPSRYQALRELLSLHWAAMPTPAQRIMLSEATLLMEAVSWEMRLVTPLGSTPPPLPSSLSIACRQRLDMKQAVAEHLQEVVRSFISASDASTLAHGETPFLISVTQQLADACAAAPESPESMLQPNASMFPQDSINDALQASSVPCLVPSNEGPLKLGIVLRDPHVFSCLVGKGWCQLPQQGTISFALPMTDGQDDIAKRCAEALHGIGISNEATCMSILATAAFRSMKLFASALLYHLAGGTRYTTIARDPRAQALRAHLEALLPELSTPMLSTQPQCRSETFAGFAEALISAMQHVESPAPLTFAFSLFRVLRGVAVHPNTTNETRSHTYQALLLLLQRVLPDLHGSAAAEGGLVELSEEDVEELRKLVCSLLARASSPITDSGSALMDAPSAAPFPDSALPLLAALLVRVPASQVKLVFATPDLWLQLTALLHTSPVVVLEAKN
jgi:hypothetical protein